jgi:hypothetical protein
MRWLQTVGFVRWCRNHPDLKENLSGGVGFVRWCRIGLWDFLWDFLNGNRRVRVHIGGPTSTIRLATGTVGQLSVREPTGSVYESGAAIQMQALEPDTKRN